MTNNVVNPTLGTLARPFGLSALIDKRRGDLPGRPPLEPAGQRRDRRMPAVDQRRGRPDDRPQAPAGLDRAPADPVRADLQRAAPAARPAGPWPAAWSCCGSPGRSTAEDTGLFDRLRRELPGILLWAIAGWKRLRLRGRFFSPRRAASCWPRWKTWAAPISAFLRDRCVPRPWRACRSATLYEAWRSWCQEHGRDAVGDGLLPLGVRTCTRPFPTPPADPGLPWRGAAITRVSACALPLTHQGERNPLASLAIERVSLEVRNAPAAP